MSNTDIESDGKSIIWQSLIDGLGILMMEDVSPGSADVREMISSSIVLTRADQEPHRAGILKELLLALPNRRDEITEIVKEVTHQAVLNFAAYDAYTALGWGAIKAGSEGAQPFMERLIIRGWDIVNGEPIDGQSARFCLYLMSAADSPSKMKARDEWAFKAFEPIATVGSKVAVELGIVLED